MTIKKMYTLRNQIYEARARFESALALSGLTAMRSSNETLDCYDDRFRHLCAPDHESGNVGKSLVFTNNRNCYFTPLLVR